MCYRVYIHTLRCDARPVLSDGKNPLVDPYAPPVPCSCRNDTFVSSDLRCNHHGCCLLSARTYVCTSDCRTAVLYHVYVQRRPSRGVHFSRSDRTVEWRDIPVFDGNIFPISAPATPLSSSSSSSSSSSRRGASTNRSGQRYTCRTETDSFRLGRDQLLEVGRILDKALSDMDKAQHEARRLRHHHRRAHGRCEDVLRTWECPWQERVANVQERGDNIQVAVEGFQRLWYRWKIYLRGLEKKGDRRVGGLEDWRRRQGRSSEREEFEHLMGYYKNDRRVDELEMRRAKEREREVERETERYRAQWDEERRRRDVRAPPSGMDRRYRYDDSRRRSEAYEGDFGRDGGGRRSSRYYYYSDAGNAPDCRREPDYPRESRRHHRRYDDGDSRRHRRESRWSWFG